MGKPSKTPRVKEPVRLRARNLSNGGKSLYLDKYADGKREYEFLKLYLIPEKSPEDKKVNAATMNAANSIKATRIVELVSRKAGIRTSRGNVTLSDWIDTIISRKKGHASASSISALSRVKVHISLHAPGSTVGDVDKKFCIGFAEYLKTAKSLRRAKGKNPKQLAPTTQAEMLNTFSIVLNEAVREEIIDMNPVRLLTSKERIKKPESSREYLTSEEVKTLIATPIVEEARNDKAAFLFGCFSGLRYSDIAALRWQNIISFEEKEKAVSTKMKKTGRTVTVPLSAEALSFLPDRGGASTDSLIFSLPDYNVTCRRLKKWVESSGIKKKVTFHVSRHTFATMMITAGADLFVVSKLLGHSDIGVTQVYARLVDRKKVEAVNLLSSLF